jgi:hypothetical protein
MLHESDIVVHIIEMKPIKSFEEAKRRLAELNNSIADLNAFLVFADDAISKVNTLKGSASGESIPQTTRAPATWGERVIEIFKQAENTPIMQKRVMEMYEKTGWPAPADRSELYRAISGAIAYLHKKKGVLVKTEEGYRLKE